MLYCIFTSQCYNTVFLPLAVDVLSFSIQPPGIWSRAIKLHNHWIWTCRAWFNWCVFTCTILKHVPRRNLSLFWTNHLICPRQEWPFVLMGRLYFQWSYILTKPPRVIYLIPLCPILHPNHLYLYVFKCFLFFFHISPMTMWWLSPAFVSSLARTTHTQTLQL